MNIYGVIILAALVLDYVLGLVADILNLRALRPELPEEFGDVYDAEAYRRSQELTRANTRLGFLASSFDLAVLLVFWLSGGFNMLDQWLRSFELGELRTGLLFIAVLIVAKSVLSLPFQLYDTFVIEERFGFNRTTLRTWILDRVKGLMLVILLGGPLLAALLVFLERAGEYAWLYCWSLAIASVLVIQFIFPTWIMPLFNKFEPLGEGELRQAIASYARSVDFSLGGIFVMDGSRRSARGNAFFAGFGKNKRIALFDTLIAQQTPSELVAVLAHEIGHYKKHHILQRLGIAIVHTGLMFFLLSIFLGHRGLFDAFGMEATAVYSGLVFFGLLYAPIELVLALGLNMMSRSHEYQADRFAVDTAPRPASMVSALKKLAADNLVNLTPHAFYVALHHSHPPVLDRIAAIRRRLETAAA